VSLIAASNVFISTSIMHPAFSESRCIGPGGSTQLPVTEKLATSLPGLPFHSRLTDEDVNTVVDAVAATLRACDTA